MYAKYANPFEEILQELAEIKQRLPEKSENKPLVIAPKESLERKRLSRKEVSKKLRRSLVTIDKYTNLGIFKRYKEGGRYFYFEDEVMNAYIEMES